jgi:hypothetical protein
LHFSANNTTPSTISSLSTISKTANDLVPVLSAAGDVIHVNDVVSALQLDRIAAAQRRSRWTEQGWLRRVGREMIRFAAANRLASLRESHRCPAIDEHHRQNIATKLGCRAAMPRSGSPSSTPPTSAGRHSHSSSLRL